MSNKVVGIIQARMSSNRLPGKVLEPILGVPMLGRVVERCKRSTLVDKWVVATSDDFSDDKIEDYCIANKITVYRGSLNNVLERYINCAIHFDADTVVRITADCPLIDHELIDIVVSKFLHSTLHACKAVGFPDGLDVEVMTRKTLVSLKEFAMTSYDKEHVTPALYHNTDFFNVGFHCSTKNMTNMMWSVNTWEDLDFVWGIYTKLFHINKDFNMDDILKLVEKKEKA